MRRTLDLPAKRKISIKGLAAGRSRRAYAYVSAGGQVEN